MTSYTIDKPCQYVLILGQHFVDIVRIYLNFGKQKVIRFTINMKPMSFIDKLRESSFKLMIVYIINEDTFNLFWSMNILS